MREPIGRQLIFTSAGRAISYGVAVATTRITVRLDSQNLAALRGLVGPRAHSASVNAAVASYLVSRSGAAVLEQLIAVTDAELGPIPDETLAWAAAVIDGWETSQRHPV